MNGNIGSSNYRKAAHDYEEAAHDDDDDNDEMLERKYFSLYEQRMNPFAESHVGAQGLMQVMSRVHHEKFANKEGNKSALNPVANIRAGALILKDYLRRGGSVEAALKLYVGAGNKRTDNGYGARVLAEYQRLQYVSQGKTAPAITQPIASPVVNPNRSNLQEADASSAQDKKI